MDKIIIDEGRLSVSNPRINENIRDKGFGHRLKAAVEEVNDLQHTADSAVEKVVSGELGIHEGMMAISKADLSLKLLLQVRNKVIDAYKEIIRMPV